MKTELARADHPPFMTGGAHLCAGHSDLGPGIDVDPAVGLPADGAPHRVRDPDNERTAGLTVPAHAPP
jgi:hypothetical protein